MSVAFSWIVQTVGGTIVQTVGGTISWQCITH